MVVANLSFHLRETHRSLKNRPDDALDHRIDMFCSNIPAIAGRWRGKVNIVQRASQAVLLHILYLRNDCVRWLLSR